MPLSSVWRNAMMYRMKVLCVFLSLTVVSGRNEVLQNPGFESHLTGHWEGTGFTMSLSSDAHSGSHSLKSSGRMRNVFLGPSQLINLEQGTMYKFSAYLKQLNDMPGKMFQKYKANINFEWRNQSGWHPLYVAYHSTVRSADGWFKMAGYFRAPTRDFMSAKLHFQAPDIGIEFLLDDCSIQKVTDLTDWKQEANQRIQQLRMGDIHLRFNLSSDIKADEIEVQIDHTKHMFGFGTLVKDQWMLDDNYKQYQDMVYDLFNTGTTQGVKWRFDKGSQGHPDFTDAIACIDAMRENGMLVRAHNLFWGFTKNLPSYVLHMSVPQLSLTVQDRLHYMLNITHGKADHWDVMNELIHGQWFEEQFHDPLYSERLYTEVHSLDPKPLLMLNDFSVIGRPEITDAYLQQAQRFLSHGVPLQGLGLQGHFHTTVPDPTLVMLLLDHVAQAGLPLWVTELDVWQQDPNVRADHYDTLLRLLFSHPAVHGVVFWGFWDQHVVDKRSSLVDGAHMEINAAGKRFIQLTKEEWSTHVNRSLSSGTQVDLTGFKGDYEVTVRRNGVKIQVIPFSLTSNETTVQININSTAKIPPPGFHLGGHQDINGGYIMGVSHSSSSPSPTLTCKSYYGHQSDTGSGEIARSKCHYWNEVMTGCTSFHKTHDWHRQGEQMLSHNGQVVCRAVDGEGTSGAVQAIAVCCQLAGLSCTYRAAGPSQAGHNTTVEAKCLHNEKPLGCGAWGAHNNGGGVVSTNTSCRASNNDLHSGVYSFAACCGSPSATLSCTTVTSQSMQGSMSHVHCPIGYSMTDCDFLSKGGAKSGGSALTGGGACQAFAAGSLSQGQSIRAVATCCKTA